MTLGELKTLLKKLPRLEEEQGAFASDLEEIARNQSFISRIPIFFAFSIASRRLLTLSF